MARGKRVGKAVQLPGMPRLLPRDEKSWQRALVEGFTKGGYAIQHVYKMRVDGGRFVTSTTAVGWPDLVCFRGEWVIGCEVKGIDTPVQPEQIPWLERFASIPTGRGWMLRPQSVDWDLLVEWIKHPERAPRRFGWGEHTITHAVDDRR